MWDILRLIQPGAPLRSNMQRDMKWDVTCCTVTFHFISRYTLLSFWKKGGHAFHRQAHSTAPRVSGKDGHHATTLMVGSLTQHCDAFSTRKEHHDQPTNSRSGGRPPDYSEKRCTPHHRLSAASSELDRLDGSSHVGLQHRGRRQAGEALCVAHRAFHRQRQDPRERADDPPAGGSAGG